MTIVAQFIIQGFDQQLFVMYIQLHTQSPSAFNRHLLDDYLDHSRSIEKELEGSAFNLQLVRRRFRLEPGLMMARHLSTTPGRQLAVPCLG